MLVVTAGLIVLTVTVAGGGPGAHAAVRQSGQAAFFRVLKGLAGTGKGSLAAAELATQNAAIDRTLAYTPYVRIAGLPASGGGPHVRRRAGPYTSKILTILEREHVPATFFEVGVGEQYFHAGTSEIVVDGYPIGDHTFSHPPMSRLSRRDQQAQLLEQASAIKRYGAPFPRLFRPPYGMWNSTTLSLLHKDKMLMVLWTVDTNDYRRPGVRAIVSSALSGARPGAIILMHDAGGNRSQTVQALPKIIAGLRDRGYRLVTVPQLLVDNAPPANQQISSVIGSGG